jgi:hypothetical protein
MNRNNNETGKKAELHKLTHIHPIWYPFIKYCEILEHGEIDKLKIQNGLPASAERTLKKTKFC